MTIVEGWYVDESVKDRWTKRIKEKMKKTTENSDSREITTYLYVHF
jgi:hypothetical protein